MLRRALPLSFAFLIAAAAAAAPGDVSPRQVGEEVELYAASPDVPRPARPSQSRLQLVWSEVLQYPGATYVAPHFSHFALPAGAHLVVRDPMGSRQWSYQGEGKAGSGGTFWGIHIYGDTAVLELWSRRALPADAVVVDRIARGFADWELPDWHPGSPSKALCGSDDSQWAKCYQSSEATAYSRSRAVARLLINGTSACTGWLVGNAGHVMTNQHCIGSSSAASNTNFELMAEGASCSTSCSSWGACPGTVVATSSTLVRASASLDYALVRLPSNPTGTYGYFRMRSTGATVGERIYVPQHPAHWGKKIAMTAGGANATVSSLSQSPCSGSGYSDVGYSADTQGGSSGSPVVGYSDHNVVALHHCAGSSGGCPNRGVPIQRVISDLGTLLPPDSTSGSPPPPTCTTYTGTLSSGGSAYQPNGSYYSSTVSGTHTGNLDGPTGTDFDLYLQKWNGSSWANVKSGTTSAPDESVSYAGTAGYYRWRVHAYSGSGSYSLCITRP